MLRQQPPRKRRSVSLDLSQITIPRVVAILALVSIIGWLWYLVDNNMPGLFFFGFCFVAPGLLGLLLIWWVQELWE